MKIKLLSIVLSLSGLLFSCSSDDENPDDNDPSGDDFTIITFENSNFADSVSVTYTDGFIKKAKFVNGVCKVPLSGEDKTIAKIQPQNQNNILIGRKEGTPIILNYNDDILEHRVAINGFIPVGTYAEFQLINSTTANDYKLEYDLDFMSLNWIPISINGKFDGDNHEINNLKITSNSNEGSRGLFSIVNSGSEISNLTIRSGSIQTPDSYLGSIAGNINDGAIITNCTNYADVLITVHDSYSRYAGGIVGGGYGGTILNCKNYGAVQGTYAAGIAFFGFTISDCHNYGNLLGRKEVYGISQTSVSDCSNQGTITLNASNGSEYYVAGICQSNAVNCTNSGNINISGNGGVNVGGIAYSGQIQNCHNSGNINSTSGIGFAGGIVGLSSSVSNCSNTGNITINATSASYVGGIAGLLQGSIYACSNKGNINTNTAYTQYSIGGIAGYWGMGSGAMELHSCYNSGNIQANGTDSNRYAGGIIGQISSVSGSLHYSYNTGSVAGALWNGGLIGLLDNVSNITLSITNNYWVDVADNAQYATGGIFWVNNGFFGINPGNNNGAFQFSATAWPSASQGWITGNGTNGYWKSLGSWNSGNSTYPKLWFEE
ncbi:MAG: hypothetical protein E6Q89_02905 [Bacteroidia bacterium]|nr:MAG: hypothetical protein E6Q89_02905 [Bacteroidia bacterium]